MKLPCSSVGLIPQVGKMGLGVIINKIENEKGEGSAVIRNDNIFLTDDGVLSNSVLVEYVNQLVAAYEGYKDKMAGKEPPKGFFVGIQDAEFTGAVKAGDEIHVNETLQEKFQEVSFIFADIQVKGQSVAKLVTKIFEITDQFPADMNPANMGTAAPATSAINDGPAPESVSSSLRRKMFSYINGLEKTDETISFKIHYPAGFDAYDGHFPGNPILPGITMLETGVLAMELFANRPVELKKVNKMKISGAILPGQVVTCSMKIAKNGGDQLDFSATIVGENNRPVAKYNGQARAN